MGAFDSSSPLKIRPADSPAAPKIATFIFRVDIIMRARDCSVQTVLREPWMSSAGLVVLKYMFWVLTGSNIKAACRTNISIVLHRAIER